MVSQANLPSAGEPSAAEPLFDLRQILSFAWRHWRFTAGITCVVLLIGITILMQLTPLYTATAQILLEREREKAPGIEAILTAADPDIAMIEGELAVLKSSVFLRRVVEREHLV